MSFDIVKIYLMFREMFDYSQANQFSIGILSSKFHLKITFTFLLSRLLWSVQNH